MTNRGPFRGRLLLAVAWVALIAGTDCPFGRGAEPPTASDLIGRFEQSLKRLDCVHLELSEKGYQALPPGAPLEETGGNDFVIFRDGNKWRSTVRRRAIRPEADGSRVEKTGTTEYIVADSFLRVEALDRPDVPASENLRLSGRLEQSRVEGQFLRELIGVGSVVFGLLPSNDNLPLVQVLRNSESAEVLPEPETVDGSLTHVLRAAGSHVVHLIWFDLNAGCLPRKIEVRSVVEPGEWPDSNAPKERVVRYENFQIQDQDDAFVITGFDLSQIAAFEDREAIFSRSVLRGKVLGLNRDGWPENPFAPTVDIPDGTLLRVEEEPTIDYAWKDGKIEKVVRVPDTEGAAFRPGNRSGWVRKAVLIANIVFVVIIGGIFVLRSRRRRSG